MWAIWLRNQKLLLAPMGVPYLTSLKREHTHTHTRLTALCLGLFRLAGTRKVKPVWISLKQETVSSSGVSCAICKSAPCSRQITVPAPHHSFFTGWMPLLPPNRQHQTTEGNCLKRELWESLNMGTADLVPFLSFSQQRQRTEKLKSTPLDQGNSSSDLDLLLNFQDLASYLSQFQAV